MIANTGGYPKKIAEDDIYGPVEGYTLYQLRDNIFQFYSNGPGSHIYLILGDQVNVIIDPGLQNKFQSFVHLLKQEIGLRVEDIHLVLNTHEHFDHISSNQFFLRCPIAAHRYAAVKIQQNDELITKVREYGVNMEKFHVHLWLENRNILDLGNIVLKTIETPGHTSGSISLYDPYNQFLFTGDTLFKGGIANIYFGGSIGELINSLEILNTLRIKCAYPGHGPILKNSEDVYKNIELSINSAKKELQKFIEGISSEQITSKSRPRPSLYKRDFETLR